MEILNSKKRKEVFQYMKKKNDKHFVSKTMFIIFIMILLSLTIYNLYIMYENIEISNDYEATRTSLSTNYTEIVDNAKIGRAHV